MNDKRDKHHGTEVSKDEMLKELGDPSTWKEEKARLMEKFNKKHSLSPHEGARMTDETLDFLSDASDKLAAVADLLSNAKDNEDAESNEAHVIEGFAYRAARLMLEIDSFRKENGG